MSRDGVKARPDQLSYERIDGETARAFAAFRTYRDQGPDRTIEKVRLSLDKPGNYSRQLWEWSSKYAWVERCALYDSWLDRMDLSEREAARPRWEQRRQDTLRHNLELCARLRERVGEMLTMPLTRERIEYSGDGRTTVYVTPNWTWSSVVAMVKCCCELEAATISEGLLDEEAAAFDPHTATLEECRAHLAKLRDRSRTKPASD